MSTGPTALAGVAIVATVLCAQTAAPRPEFEVASIKPNTSATLSFSGFMAHPGSVTGTAVSLKNAIAFAYKLKPWEITGVANWMDNDRFDIEAKAPDGSAESQIQPMIQSLLADRFKLAVHRETKEMPIYVLIPARSGLRLQAPKEGGCVVRDMSSPAPAPRTAGPPPAPCGSWYVGPNRFAGGRITMTQFVDGMSVILGKPVKDQTGYTGTFDAQFEFTPEGTAFSNGLPGVPGAAPNLDNHTPSIFTAVQDQLGIKIDAQKGSAEILVIDHAERPTAN